MSRWFHRSAILGAASAVAVTLAFPAAAAITEAPVLVSPPAGERVGSFAVPLAWRNPAGTTQYQLEVVPAAGNAPGVSMVRSAETQYTVQPPVMGGGNYLLLPDTEYIWRVRATDATGVARPGSDFGPAAERRFRTPLVSSSSIGPVMPLPGGTVDSLTPQLTWQNSNNAVFYYEVQVSPDATFNTNPATATAPVYWELVHGGASVPLNTYQVRTGYPLTDGTHHWRVRPHVPHGSTEVAWSPTWSFTVDRTDFTLTVLHNNDGESRLINAGSGPLADFGGAARFKTLLDVLRTEGEQGSNRGVVTLSSGDNFLASGEWNASLAKGIPFYDSIAMRALDYDAVDLGNHDFDFGPDVLADFIAGFNGETPFLSANLGFTGEPELQSLVTQGIIRASVVVEKGGQRIGIVGATTPRLKEISSPRNVTINPNVAAAVQAEVDRLQEQGVNKIILISHLQDVQEDLALAPVLRGVDIMIAGGGDELLANEGDVLVPGDVIQGSYPLRAKSATGSDTPVVTTAGNYKYAGRLVVDFDAQGNVIRVHPDSGPVRVAGGANADAVAPNQVLQQAVVAPVQAYVDGLASKLVATSEVALEGRRSPGIRTQETNLGNLVADALLWQARELAAGFSVPPPTVALQNGGGIRNNNLLAAGNLTELDTLSIAPFANFLSVVPNVTAATFKELMENAVSRVEDVDGRFAQIAGFRFVWDPAGTAQVLDSAGNVTTPGARVVEIQLNDGTFIVRDGSVLPEAPAVHIATIDFLARGGDAYPYRGAAFTTLGVTYQQALLTYLTEALEGGITAAAYPEGGSGRITQEQ